MALNRRNFLKVGLSGAAMAVGGTTLASCTGKPASTEAAPAAQFAGIPYQSAQLNLSLQEGVAPGDSLNEKLDFMEKNGVVGLEPGGGDLAKRVNELKQALNGRNIKISAICAGFKGFILSTDPKVRQECMDTMKEILAAAGELGSVGVIIVPAFNGQKPCMPHTQETRDFLCEQFNELGNFAHEHGTTVIFEPLNRKEAFYLRQVADAASLCRDINNPGVRCMGDFWHMSWEETSDKPRPLDVGIPRLVATEDTHAHAVVYVGTATVHVSVQQCDAVVERVFKIEVGIVAALLKSSNQDAVEVGCRHAKVLHGISHAGYGSIHVAMVWNKSG